MADGRSRALWNHTSHVLAMLVNVNRNSKKTPAFKPSDFNPHATAAKGPVIQVDKETFRAALKSLVPAEPRS